MLWANLRNFCVSNIQNSTLMEMLLRHFLQKDCLFEKVLPKYLQTEEKCLYLQAKFYDR